MTIKRTLSITPRANTFGWDDSLMAYPTAVFRIENQGWKDIFVDDVAISGNFTIIGEVQKVIKPTEIVKIYVKVKSGSIEDEFGQLTISSSAELLTRVDLKQIGHPASIVNPSEGVLRAELFAEINTLTAYDNAQIIRTDGHSTFGHGDAFYINDSLAEALGATGDYPNCIAQTTDGKFWRLLPKGESLYVRDTGAMATLEQDDTENQQPVLQELMNYAKAIDVHSVHFDSGHYSLWVEPLTGGTYDANGNLKIGTMTTGYLLDIDSKMTLVAGSGGTTINRRKPDGSDPATLVGWDELASGGIYRGGGIMLRGHTLGSDVPYQDRNTLIILGKWDFNGGIPMSDNPALKDLNGKYILDAEGRGWDVLDKGIYGMNDTELGNMEFHGDITIRGFRGELYYCGGPQCGSTYQTGMLTMRDTDGNGFNPAPRQVTWAAGAPGIMEDQGGVWAEHLRIFNCYQSAEGYFQAGILKYVEVANCVKAWAAAGRSPDTAVPEGPSPNSESAGLIIEEISIQACTWSAAFTVDTYVKSLTLIDNGVELGQFNVPCGNVRIDKIHHICHSRNIDPTVMFVCKRTEPKEPLRSVSVGHVHISMTDYAVANNHYVSRAVRWDGGEDLDGQFEGCFVEKITGHWFEYPARINNSLSHVGFGEMVRDFDHYVKGEGFQITADGQEITYNPATVVTNDPLAGGYTAAGTIKIKLPQSPNSLCPPGSIISVTAELEEGSVLEVDKVASGAGRFFMQNGDQFLFILRDSYWYPLQPLRKKLIRDVTIDFGSLALGAYSTVIDVPVANAEFGMFSDVRVWPNGSPGLNIVGEVDFNTKELMHFYGHYVYGANDPRPAQSLFITVVLDYPD